MLSKVSIIDPQAKLGKNVTVGPYSVIGPDVKIGDNANIYSHVVIQGKTQIDENCEIFPFASIGSKPQDLKFNGEVSYIKIGKNVKIREHVTINPGTIGGGGVTSVGNDCLLMVGTHIAHDCKVGNGVIFANNATLAGHVEIQDFAVIGGLSAIHQFVRIGEGAMIGGMSGVISDVIPFGSVIGNRAKLSGLNLVGLKRSNFEKNEIQALRALYKFIFNSDKNNFRERLSEFVQKPIKYKSEKKIIDFLNNNTARSFCLPG